MYLSFSFLDLSLSTFQHYEVTEAAWNPLNLSPIRPTYSLREAAIETISERRPCPVAAAGLDDHRPFRPFTCTEYTESGVSSAAAGGWQGWPNLET